MSYTLSISFVKWRVRFILIALLSYILMILFAGPMRMGLSTMGLSPLIYAPNVLILIAIVWHVLREPFENGISTLHLIALVIPLSAFLVGLLFLSPIQVAMGGYVLLPFIFGIVCGPVLLENWSLINRFVPWLWLSVSGGLLVNNYLSYPWEGFGYALGTLEVEGSREWYATGGVKRLAGFARSSFDAAGQVQILGLLLVLSLRNTLLKIIVWASTALAIVLTTSKGIFLVFIILTPTLFFSKWLPQTPLRTLPLIFGLIALLMPMSTLLFTFDSQFNDPTLANLTYSYYDRLNYMWPQGWLLLNEHGNLLLGRGLGGIGTAQTYFEPSLFNAADNIFLYWFVIFGWSLLPIIILLLLRTLRLKPLADIQQLTIFCLLLSVLVYGSMTNIVENAMFAIVCGLVLRWLFGTPRKAIPEYTFG